MEPFRPNPELRLLDQLTQVPRYHHYAYTTQKSYRSWIKHYIGFHQNRHPAEMGKPEIEGFLSYLAETRRVSASTQKQALNAIVFFYKRVLFIRVDETLEMVRAKKQKRMPVVLSQDEVQTVLFSMQGTYRLMGRLMYGGGLRLRECIRLRVKDIDFSGGKLYIHIAKGGKDRGGAKTKHTKSDASGGKVSHLESRLRMRFAPRSSGQITSAFESRVSRAYL